METQKTMNSQCNLKKGKWSWKNQAPWLQIKLQSHSYQLSMYGTGIKQKYRSMEHKRINIFCCCLVVRSLSCVPLFAMPWTVVCQASLSFTISWSLFKLVSIESVMLSNHLIFYCPLLLLSVFPGIRVFSNESALHIKWPKYWSFSFSISPSSEYSGLVWFPCIPRNSQESPPAPQFYD